MPTHPEIPLPSRLLYNTEQSSMCYTVDPYWLSILNLTMLILKVEESLEYFGF